MGQGVRVYISSTYVDLAECRAAVSAAPRQLEQVEKIVAMEDYVASDQRPLDKCLAHVDACDIYVGIFAHCYGFVPEAENPERLSITERELRQARESGKPCLIFVLDDRVPWSLAFVDSHTGDNDAGARIRALRKKLLEDTVVSAFSNATQLAGLVSTAVANKIAAGRTGQPSAPTPEDEPEPPALSALREVLGAGPAAQPSAMAESSGPSGSRPAGVPALDEDDLRSILRHQPRTLSAYRGARVAEWSQPRYALDKRFTRLTLLVDQGPDAAEGGRWQAQARSFQDLREVLAEVREPAVVLLGPPGCGKSTLLRRLELDLAVDGLRARAPGEEPLSLFLPLNRYRPLREGEPLPTPEEWLTQEWARLYPRLPGLPDLMRTQRLVLLLDAVNEMPYAGKEDYENRVSRWKAFLADLARRAPGTRAVFSCRSLDYSAPLSTPELPVPHVRIEQLTDAQVEEFLTLHRRDAGPALWHRLRRTPQLDLFRSPYYLTLLLAQTGGDGTPPEGRAALFTGFVRQTLAREIQRDNPLFRAGALLDARDRDRLVRGEWREPCELPARGPLVPALSTLAFDLQSRRGVGDSSRVRVRDDDALALLDRDPERAEQLLRAGVALQVLEQQWDDVLYVHQLLQEYFAARAVALAPRPELVTTPWRATECSPSLGEVLRALPDSDPLPQAPATGWEESFVLAAAMVTEPDALLTRLAKVHLPLAGRCAAQPDVRVSPDTRRRLQQALIGRSRDPDADLRARIAAARALGELGDPRFERRRGPDSEYLLPPMVAIEGSTYPIGSDEGLEADEVPAHQVTVAAFAIGQFPVTNAEWRLFQEAGGYDGERWWDTEASRAWRRGEGTTEGPKQQARESRRHLQGNPGQLQDWLRDGRWTSRQVEQWEDFIRRSDTEFEEVLERNFPSGRQTRPRFWDDPDFNHPSQPVVGVCWYEARAYCAWLAAQTGQPHRLPTEAEWEAAARGREGRRFAWPGEFEPARGNTFESHVRGTTPPGVFIGGDTPEGLVDMTGNVWEWSSSGYQPYPYHADDGREDPEAAEARRVVRGGSWLDYREVARCAFRRPLQPRVPRQRHRVSGGAGLPHPCSC